MSLSSTFSSTLLGSWESDMEKHFATVVQRVRPPKVGDAEVLGLKRIEESTNARIDLPRSTTTQDFVQGRGSYIREYFELVIMPIIAKAQEAFRPYLRSAARTPSDVTYIVERARTTPAPHDVLRMHEELYDALAFDSEYVDVYVDFVIVSGQIFFDIAPDFFHGFLVAYQFPFGVVLMHKWVYPKVLVIVSYSMKRGMRILRSMGAGDPFYSLERLRKLNQSGGEHSESDDETKSLTSWYSKPWVPPSRSVRRLGLF